MILRLADFPTVVLQSFPPAENTACGVFHRMEVGTGFEPAITVLYTVNLGIAIPRRYHSANRPPICLW